MTGRYSKLIDGLSTAGWAAMADFLSQDAIEALADEARELFAAGRFKQAGVGRGLEHQVRSDIRGDWICWLNERELTPVQSRFQSAIDSLRSELNRELYLGLESFEAHYAVYPPGAFYSKHVDRFFSSDERSISCTLYLNPDWRKEDGGQIRLYVAGEEIEIYPDPGAFVIFRSDSIPHEVIAASRNRYSLTGWFRRRSLRGVIAETA
jgi:SM-20-related protein